MNKKKLIKETIAKLNEMDGTTYFPTDGNKIICGSTGKVYGPFKSAKTVDDVITEIINKNQLLLG